MKTIDKTKQEPKKEFKLEQAFVLWINTAKNGTHYLKGLDLHKNKLIGFYSTKKKNPKEPDIRIFELIVDGEGNYVKGDEVCSLWDREGKNKNRYLTGLTDEKEKIVAFYSNGKNQKAPDIRGYFQEDK